ncbi:hypothetical protein [Streptomyces lonarensis]|uniref:Uncharacterized protein n=1 Tax=Streptomyces lonarensis TaxID=700599 RepID=A0A7X6CXL1_9ACTN|nr:hypothetical protein [Streptomyces lonarensis]NJQ04268.1 hypothetical protein [Streptomyces lonarensis]
MAAKSARAWAPPTLILACPAAVLCLLLIPGQHGWRAALLAAGLVLAAALAAPPVAKLTRKL